MNRQNLVKLASTPTTTSEELISIAGQYNEVDRLLAAHPNASSELLDSLQDAVDDDENDDHILRASLAKHPSISTDAFARLAYSYPLDAVLNPALDKLLRKRASLIEECIDLLELPACPVSWLKKASKAKSYKARLQVLRNPSLPPEIKNDLSPDSFDLAADNVLAKLIEKLKDPAEIKYASIFKSQAIRRPYAIPSYLPFDSSNRDHRLSDQLISGFPFTSEKWPWPKDSNGKYMQPVAQIKLINAGEVLRTKLGNELLQLWFSVDPDNNGDRSWEPVVRLIPLNELNDEVHTFYPEEAPWLVTEDNECEELLFRQSRKIVPSPMVNWVAAGSMFPYIGRFVSEWEEGDSCGNNEDGFSERLKKKIDKLPIPAMTPGGPYLDEKTYAIHLGGYVFGVGNEADLMSWNNEGDKLLLYVKDESGMFAMALTYNKNNNGDICFEAKISCDR